MLSIRNLRRPGLEPVDLDIHRGECVALSGPSGSGKSLLLRAIADLDPNEGEVSLGAVGRETLPAYEWRRRVGYLQAEPGWWAERAADHFTRPPHALIERLGLGAGHLERRIAHLSTGERQRLALARLLLGEPEALLLDEPTSGLDAAAVSRVEAVLGERLAAGCAILLVSHDPAQAARLAGRHLSMEGGRLSARGDG